MLVKITKTVIPAAGLGTRFLPYTKVIPKEMLSILNKPAIQYIVEEGIQSDLQTFLMIVNKGKQAIADHFDSNMELEVTLRERGKLNLLSGLDSISELAEFNYIRQSEPLGLGHAVWLAKHAIAKEYFSVFLPDEIIISKVPAMAQLLQVARQEKASVIAVQEVPANQIGNYGIIGIKKQITPNLFQVSHLVEKPDQKDAPSNLAVIGRYVLSHKIFPALESIQRDSRGELQLTDGISQMILNSEKLFAVKVQGLRYDIGNPLGWLKANIGCALENPIYAPYVKELFKDQELVDNVISNKYTIKEFQR